MTYPELGITLTEEELKELLDEIAAPRKPSAAKNRKLVREELDKGRVIPFKKFRKRN